MEPTRYSPIIATTADPSINGALLSTRDETQIMSQIDRHATAFGGTYGHTKVFVVSMVAKMQI